MAQENLKSKDSPRVSGFGPLPHRSGLGHLEGFPVSGLESAAAMIAQAQSRSGEIPWWPGGKTDPWDHVEASMGLAVGGFLAESRRAMEWMADIQLSDGSWYSAYEDGVPTDFTREAHLSAYIAVGVFHHFMITRDMGFLRRMWGSIHSAIGFCLNLQAPEGEIFWAVSPEGKTDPMSLLTGSSSVYLSIKCALAVSEVLGYRMPAWENALRKLKEAICFKPKRFNMEKARHSMDWFYPVLSGAVTGAQARERIDRFWGRFVVFGLGARCVSDRPWITVAETSELSMALSAMGSTRLAQTVFRWICDSRYEDGTYWCGFTFPDITVWPEEKNTWTNGAVLMAADTLHGITPAARLFDHRFWRSYDFIPRHPPRYPGTGPEPMPAAAQTI